MAREDGACRWQGGSWDTVESTLRRELLEETALHCRSSRFLFYQDSLPAEPGGMHWLNLYFECWSAGEVRLNSESSDFAWVAQTEIGAYHVVFRNDEALARYWQDEGAPREPRSSPSRAS